MNSASCKRDPISGDKVLRARPAAHLTTSTLCARVSFALTGVGCAASRMITFSVLLARSDALAGFGMRNGVQELIDGAEVVVTHVSEDRPRHHLKNLAVVRVATRANQRGQRSGRQRRSVRWIRSRAFTNARDLGITAAVISWSCAAAARRRAPAAARPAFWPADLESFG